MNKKEQHKLLVQVVKEIRALRILVEKECKKIIKKPEKSLKK